MKNYEKIKGNIEKKITSQQPINLDETNLKLHMQGTLPYLLIYRYRNDPHKGVRKLIQSFSSGLMANNEYKQLEKLVEVISHSISKIFNSFLIIELIPLTNNGNIEISSFYDETHITIATLKKALEHSGLNEVAVKIKKVKESMADPLLSKETRKDKGVFWIGLSFPVSLLEGPKSDTWVEHFTDVFKKVGFNFMRIQTSNHFSPYLMHEHDKLDKKVEEIDQELADISDEMSFLLNTTPVNDSLAWEEFKSSNYEEKPQFTYRTIKFDPEKLKERLFRLDMDGVKGTTVDYILRQKRIQLEIELTLLQSREAVGAQYLGHYLYGAPNNKELKQAKEILKKVKVLSNDDEESVNCHEFAEIAQSEIDYLKKEFQNENIAAEVRNDIVGIMVDKTKVYISEGMSIKRSRVEALIQHEIGTHILTYCNGLRQPLKQLYAGFAGYNQLQEGLAVLSEYFVDGLSGSRLRTLAARVIAADCLVKGNSFNETYNLLVDTYNFPKRISFNITLRIFRGGGLIKDVVYLRGVILLLDYLQDGGNIELLYTGKFALHYVPLISKLLEQGVLKQPILPNHFKEEDFQNRIEALRNKKFELIDLID
ncbi:tyrosine/phenylalanine carboxypeptidase domain-containing protein [Gramella sp. AN32]|uniref:Flavohemoglobin expression-modulating QEGLA motif protein n=1 Tax=Christiangramia antarctica TaxID=2058158 RepID=A0ABW5X162_9FLAO|nr:tyrosine/phenylalanine carboxypeptidase domain-containing protein [Gramella sp. AN32]